MIESYFEGTAWHYRNPNTVYFVALPEELSAAMLALVGTSLDSWDIVPVDVTIEGSTWYTSMFPRDKGRYYDPPLKLKYVSKLGLVDDQVIDVHIPIALP